MAMRIFTVEYFKAKYITALFFLFLLHASTPTQSLACSCIAPAGPLVELGSSDFVFSGVVKSITPINSAHGGNLIVKLQVLSKWKGDLTEEVVVVTANNSAACGYPFEKGTSYLVYGYENQNVMQTGICTRTTRLEDADEDLRDLKAGEEVSTIRPRCGGPTSAAVIQTFMFLMIGIGFLRKKPDHFDIS